MHTLRRRKELFLRNVSNSFKQSRGCYPLETSTLVIMKQCYNKSQKKILYNYCYFNFQVSKFFFLKLNTMDDIGEACGQKLFLPENSEVLIFAIFLVWKGNF